MAGEAAKGIASGQRAFAKAMPSWDIKDPRIWVTGILTPLKGPEGELVGFGKVMRNRTDLKSRIEWLESHLDKHRKANERKNLFVSTLAHEIRSPLAAISTSLELMSHPQYFEYGYRKSCDIARRHGPSSQ